jgi:hypothetical protein
MHPEILRALGSQHSREMQDQAHQVKLARAASRARRASRRGLSWPDNGDELIAPAIPDYVDGSFRSMPLDDRVDPVSTTGRVA